MWRKAVWAGTLVMLLSILAHTAVASEGGTAKTSTSPLPSTVRFAVDLELSSPLIGSLAGGDNPFKTRAIEVRFGLLTQRVGAFVFAEYAHFDEPSYDAAVSNNLFSFGAGVSVDYFRHHMRSMISVGSTVLLTESFQNEVGTMGLCLDVRPAGFVWTVRRMTFQLYPITLNWVTPVLQNIPLIYVHFRTIAGFGGIF